MPAPGVHQIADLDNLARELTSDPFPSRVVWLLIAFRLLVVAINPLLPFYLEDSVAVAEHEAIALKRW